MLDGERDGNVFFFLVKSHSELRNLGKKRDMITLSLFLDLYYDNMCNGHFFFEEPVAVIWSWSISSF